MNFLLLFFFATLLFQGCDQDLLEIPAETEGLAPVYARDSIWQDVGIEMPRLQDQIDDVMKVGHIHFLVERYEGIHVVNMQDSLIPEFISFIRIPGVAHYGILNDRIYSANYTDVVEFDIQDPYNIQLFRRIRNVYLPEDQQELPIAYRGYLECPDTEYGIILGWKKEILQYPSCWKQ